MAQFRFVVDGDFVDFYDGSMHAFRVRNTTQDVDWYYETEPGISFEVDGHRYNTVPSQIEIDGVTLSANTEFDAAIAGIFPNLTGGGEGGGITTVGSVGAGDAKGASISGSTIFMHKATETQPGLVGVDTNQTFGGNKSFSGSVQFQNPGIFETIAKIKEIAAPSAPAAGYINLYAKTDKKLYFKDSDNLETEIGGGILGIDDVLSEAQVFTANREINMGGFDLAYTNGAEVSYAVSEYEVIVPGGQANLYVSLAESYMRGHNNTGGGNESNFVAGSGDSGAQFNASAVFNDGEKLVSIAGSAASGVATIIHTADTHTINGSLFVVENNSIDLLEIDDVSETRSSYLKAFHATGDGNFGEFNAHASETNSQFYVTASFNDGAKSAQIVGISDVSVSKLTYTADDHIFIGVQEFADNAAAVTGGKGVGTLYRTGDALKIVHA